MTKIPGDPRDEQPEAQRKNDITARRERPPVKSDFANRPDQRANQYGSIDPQCRTTPGNQQHTGYQNAETGGDVVDRPTQHGEPCTSARERQANQGVDDTGYCYDKPPW